jgi:Trk K+ transport system NAD-binding subunit
LARSSRRSAGGVVVIGLGRFGTALAQELVDEGVEVLGIDGRGKIVQDLSGQLTHVVQADSTDEDALRQLSVHEFDRVVVAIGNDVEASILTASLILQFGVPNVWAKAISQAHARILTQLGVHHVVRPEHDMGQRVAHLVAGRMLDYIEFDDDFAMAKTTPPAALLNQPLKATHVRREHGVTVVAVKPPGRSFTYATPDTVLRDEDLVIVSGTYHDVERFTDLT